MCTVGNKLQLEIQAGYFRKSISSKKPSQRTGKSKIVILGSFKNTLRQNYSRPSDYSALRGILD